MGAGGKGATRFSPVLRSNQSAWEGGGGWATWNFGNTPIYIDLISTDNDDDEFRFNDASTHEGHLRQNGELTWFCSETIIMIRHKCIKCKTRTNLKN